MGKGENARYKQFLLFPQCFQKACFPGASKGAIVWECFKGFSDTDYVENIVGNGEIAHFGQFCLFPKCFPEAFFSK